MMALDASAFTKSYGPLKGWQWVTIIGGGGGIVWYLLKARKAAAPATDPSLTGDAAGPPLGTGSLTTIIVQQGQGSTPKPGTPPGPPKPGGLPRLNSHNFPEFLDAWGSNAANVVRLGTIGKPTAHVTGGAPVYALVGSAYGPIWKQYYDPRRLPKNTPIATLSTLRGYVVQNQPSKTTAKVAKIPSGLIPVPANA